MTKYPPIDTSNPTPEQREAIARLTEKERECLRRWLDHRTAKQIAIDLNISHHAVEKRLKTARAKLAVSSSLDAAQLLDHVERYDQTASQPADLPKQPKPIQPSGSKQNGALIMTLAMTLAAGLSFTLVSGIAHDSPDAASAMTVQLGGEQDADASAERQTMLLSAKTLEFKQASDEEIREWLGWIFRTTDKDANGFIETSEAPHTFPQDDAMGQIILSGASAQKAFVADHDGNSDGKVSEEEFINASFAAFKESGIPLLREGFIPVE